MVYPFDSLTGTELADNAITENGFKLDMAKSKYLTIDVQRSVLVVGTDGYLTEDVRFNRPAKDGETYTNEGIYTFIVKNLYTNEETTKTIYVGANSYLRALSATGMSIEELNAQIEAGAIVHENGTIEVMEPTVDTTPTEPSEETEPESTPSATVGSTEESPTAIEEPEDNVPPVDEEPTLTNIAPYVVGAIVVALVASIFVAIKRKKTYQARLLEEEADEE